MREVSNFEKRPREDSESVGSSDRSQRKQEESSTSTGFGLGKAGKRNTLFFPLKETQTGSSDHLISKNQIGQTEVNHLSDHGEAIETAAKGKDLLESLREKLIPCLTRDHPETKTLKKMVKNDYGNISHNEYIKRKEEIIGLENAFKKYMMNEQITDRSLSNVLKSTETLRELSKKIAGKHKTFLEEFLPYYVLLHHEDKSIKDVVSILAQEKCKELRDEKGELMEQYKRGIEQLSMIKTTLDQPLLQRKK